MNIKNKRGRKKACKENVSIVPEKKKKQMLPWSVRIILEAINKNYRDTFNHQLVEWSEDGRKVIISSIDCFINIFMSHFSKYDDKNRFANFKHNLNDWRFSCVNNPDKDGGVFVEQIDGFFKRDNPGEWKKLRYGRDRYTPAELVKMNEAKDEIIDELRTTVAEQEAQNIELGNIIEQHETTIEQYKMTIESMKKERARPTLTPNELKVVDGVIDYLGHELYSNKSSQNSHTLNEAHEFPKSSQDKFDTDDEGEEQTPKPKKEAIIDCDTNY